MRRLLVLSAIVAALIARTSVHADDLVFNRFGDYLDALRTQAGVPGLAAVIVGSSDILWEGAYGKQDVERSISMRSDTPIHIDGLTQMFTASLILRCVEQGALSLDDRVGEYLQSATEPNATVRQLLTHTFSDGTFKYSPERLNVLAYVIAGCNSATFRSRLASGFDVLAMIDSVPGPDMVQIAPDVDGFSQSTLDRYARIISRLATPYAVDSRSRPSATRYTATTLTAAGGAISTARDLGEFVLGIRRGLIVRPETLAMAWKAPVSTTGQRLPHGMGWFVQSYNGETIVWQFGVTENVSSSLIVTVPRRDLTMVLLANSDGLSRSFPLASGDLTTSPFGRLFLGTFVR